MENESGVPLLPESGDIVIFVFVRIIFSTLGCFGSCFPPLITLFFLHSSLYFFFVFPGFHFQIPHIIMIQHYLPANEIILLSSEYLLDCGKIVS